MFAKEKNMIRIWAKIYKNNRIVKDTIYESIDNFHKETFYVHVQELCHKLDIPTPLILNYHISSYIEFNRCIFKPADFVEQVHFDKLVLEEASL